MFKHILALATLMFFVSTHATAQDATAIMKKSEEITRVNSIHSKVSLVTGTKGKKDKQKTFDSWRKLRADKIHSHSLSRFIEPASVHGEAVLIQEFPDNQNNVFIYLPRFKKTRRVEGYDQGKSFMGTVFSYSDISTFHYTSYKHKYLKTESCDVEAGNCYVIESTPKNEDIRNRTRYSKSVHWVSERNGLVLKTEAYDLDGKLLKRIVTSKYIKVNGGRWVATHVRALSLADGKFSILEYQDPKVGVEISDSLFAEESMATIPW